MNQALIWLDKSESVVVDLFFFFPVTSVHMCVEAEQDLNHH